MHNTEENNCMANRMADKISTQILVIDRVKMWRRANVWEGNWGKEIVFCRELGRDLIGGMAAYRWVRNCFCVCLVTGNRNSRIYSFRVW